MAVFLFSSFVDTITAGERTISFTVAGDILVQERIRVVHKGRRHPVIYDPSSAAKKTWVSAFKRFIAVEDPVTTDFPLFSNSNPSCTGGFELEISFFLMRRAADYIKKTGLLAADCHKYPKKKDLDNLTKFLMDAMNGIIYDDDSAVVKITVTKQFVSEDDKLNGSKTIITIRKK